MKERDLTEGRKSIPETIKHRVRQKCGFGCIFCGLPFFQYDHLLEQAQGGEDTEENLNLLCANHHDLKTRGQISRDAVKQRSLNPVNKSRERTAGMPLLIPNSTAIFEIGPIIFEHEFEVMKSPFRAIEIGGRDFVSGDIEDGWLKFDATITNDWGFPLLTIESGELHASTGVWDYNLVGPRIIIREVRSQISVELFIREDRISLTRGRFANGPLIVEVQPDRCILGPDMFAPPMLRPRQGPKNQLTGGHFKNNRVGVSYG